MTVSPEDASRIVLGRLNPDEQPRVVLVKPISMDGLGSALSGIGPYAIETLLQAITTNGPLYLVLVTLHPQMVLGNEGRPRDEIVDVAVLLSAMTGQPEVWGEAVPLPGDSADDMAIRLSQLNEVSFQVTTSVQTSSKPMAAATSVVAEPISMPRGIPLTAENASEVSRAALRYWPVLPQNVWVSQTDSYEHYLWTGERVTDTVMATEILGDDIVLVRIRQDSTRLPGAAELGDVRLEETNASTTTYSMLWRDEYFDHASPELITYFQSHSPVPTVTTVREYVSGSTERPMPWLKLPIHDGFQTPFFDLGADWIARPVGTMTLPAGSFTNCHEVLAGGNIAIFHWLCDGVGEVRFEVDKAGSVNVWTINRLLHANISHTIR